LERKHRYTITIEPVAGCREDEAIRGLRWLLKQLLRQYGLKCVLIRKEELDEKSE
jgi:hypothetical protein